MVSRAEIKSIVPYLPPLKHQPPYSFSWPNPQVIDHLTSLTNGPSQSNVTNGETLFRAISTLRNSLNLNPKNLLAKSTANGFAKFFDELLPIEDCQRWFQHVVPSLADLVLRLPSILESHYRNCDGIINGVSTGLRILEPQQPGIVFLHQEFIAALLSCSFFCLFPIVNRRPKRMNKINVDQLFSILHDKYDRKQENKIKCIVHYFERVCSSKPSNYVSFERKVLSPEKKPSVVPLPSTDSWANSVAPLCKFKVFNTGSIEHHAAGSLEVDFADEVFGGLTLTKGCVQEEIRFLINPELIAGMLFLPSISENEAIEMVGAERFSNYKGYKDTFQYVGDYVDKRELDPLRRRISRILAIDALRRAGTRQYQNEFLLREVNKAYCGFLDHTKYLQNDVPHSNVGIVTGNWGCGVFRGDPQIKSIIQWVAASQASRPFFSYYTYRNPKVQNLDQVVEWIVSQNWTVGDLWIRLSEFCRKRANGGTKLGFFPYLLPSLNQDSGRVKRSQSGHGRSYSGNSSRGGGKRGRH